MSNSTKQAMADSLIALLKEKPLSKITVSEIVNGCGVSRMTFYYHFKDVYDLLEWTFRNTVEKAIIADGGEITPSQASRHVLFVLKENKELVFNVYHSVSRESLTNYLYEMYYEPIYNKISELCKGHSISESDKEFIANFFKCALVGTLLSWVRAGMHDDPEELMRRLNTVEYGAIHGIISDFEGKAS